MTLLRLHQELYAGTCVDTAAQVYRPHAAVELFEEASYWCVRVTANEPERERQVAGELANYALGLTVKEQRP